jgi:hypothetical protein
LPQQGDVIQFLHLPINAADCEKRTDYFTKMRRFSMKLIIYREGRVNSGRRFTAYVSFAS